jgi:hypothetical protein
MHEDEAKQKWCPMVRTVNHHIGVRGGLHHDEMRSGDVCIASNCMMWRWDTEEKFGNRVLSEVNGHCGLAGNPLA